MGIVGVTSGVTTGTANPGGPNKGGILMIGSENWQIYAMFDLATADGQKIIGGGKKLGVGGKNLRGRGKKVAS